jgi:hypothetical protein
MGNDTLGLSREWISSSEKQVDLPKNSDYYNIVRADSACASVRETLLFSEAF